MPVRLAYRIPRGYKPDTKLMWPVMCKNRTNFLYNELLADACFREEVSWKKILSPSQQGSTFRHWKKILHSMTACIIVKASDLDATVNPCEAPCFKTLYKLLTCEIDSWNFKTQLNFRFTVRSPYKVCELWENSKQSQIWFRSFTGSNIIWKM